MPTRNINSDLKVNADLTLPNLPTYSGSEVTTLMIAGADVVGKRDLGTNAFNSTSFLPLTGGTMTGDILLGAFNKISGIATDNLVIGVDKNNASGGSSIDFQLDGSTSALFINNSRNVGIGTTNPSRKLVVAGQIGLSGTNTYIFGGDDEILAGQDGNGYYFATGNGQNVNKPVNIGDNNSYIRFKSGDAERMRILSSGQVIVGGTDYGYAGTDLQVGNTSDSQNGLNILTSTTGYGYLLFGDGTGAASYVGQISYKHGDDFMAFRTQGTEKLRITSSGEVGIGTTSPDQALQVIGNISLGNYSGADFSRNVGIDDVNGGYSAGSSYIRFQELSASGTTNTTKGCNIRFYNHLYAGGTNETLTIQANGNVGIGATTPESKLHIVDSGSSTQLRLNQSGDNDAVLGSGTNFFTIKTGTAGNTNALSILHSNQNVGIGTTSPEVKLHIGTATLGVAPDTNADIFSSGGVTLDTSKRLSFDADYYIHGNIRYIGSGTAEAKLEYQGYYGHHFIRRSGNSAMVIKGDTGNVGIGTTSPSQKLEVAGHAQLTINNPQLIFNDTSDSTYASSWMYKNNVMKYVWGGGEKFSISSNGGITIGQTYTASAAPSKGMIMEGRLGIGTTAPNRPLHVIGQFAIDNSTSPSGGLLVSPDGNSNKVYSRTGNANTTAHPLDFISGSSTSMRIAANGNVGIGTTSPSKTLEVNGTLKTASDITCDGTTIFGGTSSLDINLFAAGSLKLKTNNTTALTINSSQNVGIGTTSPFSKLTVVKAGINEGTISFDDQANNAHLTLAGSDSLVRLQMGTYNNGSYGVWIQGSYDNGGTNYGTEPIILNPQGGRVGIGTTSPAYTLHVEKGSDTTVLSRTTSNAASASFSTWNNNASSGNYMQLKSYGQGVSGTTFGVNVSKTNMLWSNNDALMAIGTIGATPLIFGTSNAERMRILSNGNVGIGTTSPQAKLHVESKILISQDTGDRPKLAFSENVSNDDEFVIEYNGAGGGTGNYVAFYSDVSSWTNIGDGLNFIPANGRVGIGTITPSEKLEVVGDIKASSSANTQVILTSGGGCVMDLLNAQSEAYVRTTSAHDLHFRTTDTNRMVIKAAGNVGIGTVSPDKKLNVHSGATSDIVKFQNNNGSIVIGKTANLGSLDMASDASFRIRHGSTVSAFFKSDGNVGIGTTDPAYKLDVNGAARSTHFIDGAKGTGTTPATAGWYKIASWSTGGKRGGTEIKLSTTGGTLTPITWIIRCYKNWGNDATLKLEQYGYANVYLTKARIVQDTSTNILHLEVYQGVSTALTFFMYQTSLMGYDSFVTMATGTLAAGTTGGTVRTELPFVASGTSLEDLYVNDNVSIGTTATSRLTVKSNSVSSADSGFTLQANANTNPLVKIGERSNNKARLHMYASGVEKIAFYTDGTANHISAGNVGIGTTSPSSLLHLESASSPSLRIKDTTQGTTLLAFSQDSNAHLGTFSNHPLVLDTNSSERMRITSAGNVGIGTTDPSDQDLSINTPKLHVVGPSTTGAFNLVARFQGGNDSDNTGAAILINHSNDRGLLINAGRADSDREVAYFNLVSSGANITNMLTLKKVGSAYNVGIGTTSPSRKLHVNAGVDNEAVRIESTDTEVALELKDTTGTATIRSRGDFRFDGSSGEILRMETGGNVGIGTTSPSSKLHVAGQIMISPSSGTPSLKFQDSGTTNAYIDLTDGQQRFDFRDDSDTVMSVRLDTLRVGIGTTSPSQKLHVEGNIELQSAWQIGSNTGSYWQRIRTEDSSVSTTNAFNFETRNGSGSFIKHMVIRNDGNVGVGNATPAAKLAVEGTIAHKVYTVSTLPSASPAGQRAFVSDSSYSVSQAHGLVTVGSGSNFCPMYSDGTNWRVG